MSDQPHDAFGTFLRTLREDENFTLGKADWLWEEGLKMHLPCCGRSDGAGGRCHNGPLTGEQIKTGDCGEH